MVYLIYGSPCSGKSTYIKNHMTDNDIVCDVDLIYEAIGNRTAHDADLYVHEVALQLKEKLLDIIKDRQGGWKDAYVVSIANTDELLEKDVKRINSDKVIFIDTPEEVCLERAKERPQEFFGLFKNGLERGILNVKYKNSINFR